MHTVELDVRPFHERGEEPFNAIMDAVENLQDGEQLLLVNSFEPKPLYAVMKKYGFGYAATKVGDDEWRVLFTREL